MYMNQGTRGHRVLADIEWRLTDSESVALPDTVLY